VLRGGVLHASRSPIFVSRQSVTSVKSSVGKPARHAERPRSARLIGDNFPLAKQRISAALRASSDSRADRVA
jgi:hypothetical protein